MIIIGLSLKKCQEPGTVLESQPDRHTERIHMDLEEYPKRTSSPNIAVSLKSESS